MRLSVIGGGLAGLGVAYFAQQKGFHVRVYIGGDGASHVGSGCLHPYGGLRGKMNRFGLEGMEETVKLLDESCILHKGIFRLGVNEALKNQFYYLSLKDPKVKWMSGETIQKRNPGVGRFDGIWIEEGRAIDMKLYLKTLEQKLVESGVEVRREWVEGCFWADIVIWAKGAYENEVGKVKGQALKITYKDSGLIDPINAHCYVIPNKKGFLVGATYEKGDVQWSCDLEKAKSLLFPKLKEVMPFFDESRIEEIECLSGIRAVTKDHLPLIKKVNEKTWIYTGLGSKGLLYHALFAKKLIEIIAVDEGTKSEDEISH